VSLSVHRADAPARRAGRGRLRVVVANGRSTAVSVQATSPLKVLVPRSSGDSVWAYLSSFGGGLVAGDETDIDVDIGPGARCFLGTQASTKVYRNPLGLPCGHRLRAVIGEGAVLVLAPDPVQAFAGSSYRQRQEFRLAAGAGLVLVDGSTSGRAARGERWGFDRYQGRNDISLGRAPLPADSVLLDPADGPLDSPHRAGRFNGFALVALVGEPLAEASARMLAEVAARPVQRRAPLVVAASPIRGGALLRIAGESVEEVGREVRRHLGCLSGLLGEDPLARRW